MIRSMTMFMSGLLKRRTKLKGGASKVAESPVSPDPRLIGKSLKDLHGRYLLGKYVGSLTGGKAKYVVYDAWDHVFINRGKSDTLSDVLYTKYISMAADLGKNIVYFDTEKRRYTLARGYAGEGDRECYAVACELRKSIQCCISTEIATEIPGVWVTIK